MRLVFFLLVLANLLFYVWSAGYLGGQEEGREPQRLQSQLQPEKITVTPVPPAAATEPVPPAPAPPAPTQIEPAPAAPAPTPTTPAPAPTAPAAPASPAAQAPVAAAQPSLACRRVDGVAAKDGGLLQQSLQKAGFVVAVLPMDDRSFWVNIPALPNKAAADKKAGELKLFGITDFHVMQGEGGGFVISLGVFKEETSATQFLQGLVKKGVKSARMETRSKPAAALRLELRGGADLFAQRLPQLLAGVPGAKAADCP